MVVLAHWSKCLLLGVVLDLSLLLAVGSICEATIQSFYFLFVISKIKKHFLVWNYGIFSFDYVTLILTHVERFHFIEIVEISLEKLHLESYYLFEIQY